MTLYPSLPDVLAAHARLIVLFGGAQGIRDRGALEAALGRPQSGYYRDVIEQAALKSAVVSAEAFGSQTNASAVLSHLPAMNRLSLGFEVPRKKVSCACLHATPPCPYI